MALTQYYVDPSINAASGAGTVGDPYGDLQHALDTITRDAVNGDQINIKAGTAEVLVAAIDLTTYGTPSWTAPLVLRGYTATANDGGIGDISGGDGNFICITGTYVHLIDLYIHNTGSERHADITYGSAINCEVAYGTNWYGGLKMIYGIVIGCYVHDLTQQATGEHRGIEILGGGVYGCYLVDTNIFPAQHNTGTAVVGNICKVTSTAHTGIHCYRANSLIATNNIVYHTGAGTKRGIYCGNGGQYAIAGMIANNIIVGFSGAGGEGIEIDGSDAAFVGYNAFYNCTNNYTWTQGCIYDMTAHDVALGADPFTSAATGDFSLTVAAKAALRGVGFPTSYPSLHANTDGHITIGAIQYGESEGGSVASRLPRVGTFSTVFGR